MKLTGVILAATVAMASGFRTTVLPTSNPRMHAKLQMTEGEGEGEKYSYTVENIELTSGTIGGVLGLLTLGPIGGVLSAGILNYLAKQDNEGGEVIRGVSRTTLQAINYLSKINEKYGLGEKAAKALGDGYSKIKESDSEKILEKSEEVFSKASAKLDELNKEYDLTSKGKDLLGKAGELSAKAIDKSVELTKEYEVVDKVKTSVDKVISSSSTKATPAAEAPKAADN